MTATSRMLTSASWTEVLSAYLYDWNQDGSSGLRGTAFVADGEQKPQVGDRLVLYGEGLAVVTTVTMINRAANDDGWVIDTTWNYESSGSIRTLDGGDDSTVPA